MENYSEDSLYTIMLNSTKDIQSFFLTKFFKDPKIEQKYITLLISNNKSLKLLFLIFYLTFYTITFIYGLSNAIKLEVFYIIILGCSIGTIISAIFYLFVIKCPYVKGWIELLIIFLYFLFISSSIFCFVESKMNEARIIRLIYSLIASKYLSLLIWSRSKSYIWLIFSLLTIAVLVLKNAVFKKNNEYLADELIIEVVCFLMSFTTKNSNDSSLRFSFLQGIKFQEYFNYNKNLINNMTGLHMTFSGNDLIYMNDNIKNLLKTFMVNGKFNGKLI